MNVVYTGTHVRARAYFGQYVHTRARARTDTHGRAYTAIRVQTIYVYAQGERGREEMRKGGKKRQKGWRKAVNLEGLLDTQSPHVHACTYAHTHAPTPTHIYTRAHTDARAHEREGIKAKRKTEKEKG